MRAERARRPGPAAPAAATYAIIGSVAVVSVILCGAVMFAEKRVAGQSLAPGVHEPPRVDQSAAGAGPDGRSPANDATAGADGGVRLEDVLTSVRQGLCERPPQWPSAWQQEYVDAIGRALEPYGDREDFNLRGDAFRRGFAAFWAGIDTESCGRMKFESYAAQMRWFVELLMSRPLPSREAKDTVRRQFEALCEHALQALQGEFPFLADAPREAARRASLREYHAMIEDPLVPLFMTTFTPEQMGRIRQLWAGSYKRRAALWRAIRDESTDLEQKGASPVLTEHPHYRFVKRCLDGLPDAIWPMVETPPEYVLQALGPLNKEKEDERRRHQLALFRERELESQCSYRLERLEQWSFVLAALLETPLVPPQAGDGSPPRPAAETGSSAEPKGGDAYDLTE